MDTRSEEWTPMSRAQLAAYLRHPRTVAEVAEYLKASKQAAAKRLRSLKGELKAGLSYKRKMIRQGSRGPLAGVWVIEEP